MPGLWDYFFGRKQRRQRNLQEGLFQIASQTCNLLVQVNNTNNITFGNNSSNIQLNNFPGLPIPEPSRRSQPHSNGTSHNSTSHLIDNADQEQLVVLLPSTSDKTTKYKPGLLGKPRLSTVLEGPPLQQNEISPDMWAQTYSLPTDNDGSPVRRWGHKNRLCRPSCIPLSIICILIFLVVLLPLLDHATEKVLQELNYSASQRCSTCRLSLIESIPEGLVYDNDTIQSPSTFDTWLNLISSARQSIDIASLYWTLRQSEVYPDPTSIRGEAIFQALLKAGTERGIKIRIAQNAPTQNYPNIDTELLMKRKAAEVRSLNFQKLIGGGVLHTKLWIIDREHVYVGSANMDWRSLTQVKELGIAFYNCSCLADDVSKVFEVYWQVGKDGKVPSFWPESLSTKINKDTPLNLPYGNDSFQTYFSSAPPELNPNGRTNDIEALVDVIQHADKFVYIAVMDYFPLMIFSPKITFWPVIDDALKSAAINHHVKVKMLISWWNHSRSSEDYFLRSLASVNQAYPRVSIEVRRFIVPANKEQQKIPFARVNHNKYMVTDNTAYIGTSNWSGDYFVDTAGVGFILHDPVFERNATDTTIRSQLQAIFERDWNSNYSHPFEM